MKVTPCVRNSSSTSLTRRPIRSAADANCAANSNANTTDAVKRLSMDASNGETEVNCDAGKDGRPQCAETLPSRHGNQDLRCRHRGPRLAQAAKRSCPTQSQGGEAI